jgi:hypothetical protein
MYSLKISCITDYITESDRMVDCEISCLFYLLYIIDVKSLIKQ